MKRCPPWVLSAALCGLVLAGCGGGDSTDVVSDATRDAAGETIRRVDPTRLPPVGDFLGMAALDDGRVMIAPPTEWERGSRSAKYLAAFFQGRGIQVPRILVTVSDSPYDVSSVTESNVESFAQAVLQHLQETEVRVLEDPLPMIIGPNAFARYVVGGGQHRGVPVERQILATVFDNRLYEVELTVYEKRILDSRDYAYAVGGGMKFLSPSDDPSPPLAEEPVDAGE